MGEVFAATQLNLEREVAIKVMRSGAVANPLAVERFKREALAVARLRHPNIVVVFDFGISAETGAYLVMERLRGRSIRDEIEARRRIPIAEAVTLMQPICLAVHAAHQAGVLHRDLKPANLFIEEASTGSTVKVLDFGVAKLGDVADPTPLPAGAPPARRSDLTLAGSLIGTPLYMAPEQCLEEECDARADVYSLGCVLYEMITGRPPISGGSAVHIMMAKTEHAPLPARDIVPEIPEALDAALQRALAPKREDRFATAADMAAALAAVVGAQTETAPVAKTVAPAPRTSNLPKSVTLFVGDARRVAEIAASVLETRLVTLAGPGGIGKTRLALEVSASLSHEFPDGVWMVDFTPLRDQSLVASTAARVFGVREEMGRPIVDVLCEALARKRSLIVFDNCEHVVAASGELAERLLQSCGRVCVLATSRERLGLVGESIHRVEPLDPDDASRLFVDRAKLGRPGFALTEHNAGAVDVLCRRLDGIPLAIELAAARVRVLTVEQILSRMDDRFRLLSYDDGRSTLDHHHRLRATLDWSHSLLTEDERTLFSRLSVFAGGFLLEAVEAVCSGGGVDELAVLDLVNRLVDKSLVMVEEAHNTVRFRLLETIRQYGWERLVESGAADRWRRAHRDWYLNLAERLVQQASGAMEGEYLDTIEVEHDNFRIALQWSVREACEASESLRMAGAISYFWESRGIFREGRKTLEDVLALDGHSTLEARALAHRALVRLGIAQGDYPYAAELAERNVALRREIGVSAELMTALGDYAAVLFMMGESDRSSIALDEVLVLALELGDEGPVAHCVYLQGMLAMWNGDLDGATKHFQRCLASFRAMERVSMVGTVLNNLGEVER